MRVSSKQCSRWRRTAALSIFVSMVFVCLGKAETQETQPRAVLPGAPETRYLLRAGDTLELTFPFAADFNQLVSVEPDGYLGLRGVGEIKVAGLTLPAVEDSIRTAYAKIMKNPQFSLTLKDFAKPFYIVAGEVKSGGTKELRGDVTVMQALMSTGGFTADAKHSRVLVFRRLPHGWYEVKELNAKRMLSSGNLNEDVRVQDGDIIFVPKSKFGKVNRFIPVYSLSSYMGGAF